MQGPRLPSHGAGRQITLHRLEKPLRKEEERQDEDDTAGQNEDSREARRHPSTRSPPLDEDIGVVDTGGTAAAPMPARHLEDASSDTCSSKRSPSQSRTRLNKTVAWGRRHLRFIGPGLSECRTSFICMCCHIEAALV